MTRNILRISAISILAILIFLVGYALGQSSLAPVPIWNPMNGTPKDFELALEPFWETWHYLHEEYFDQPLDDEILVEGAL